MAGAAFSWPPRSVSHTVLPVLLSNAKSVPHSQPAITFSPTTAGEDSVRPGSERFQNVFPSRVLSAITWPGSRFETKIIRSL